MQSARSTTKLPITTAPEVFVGVDGHPLPTESSRDREEVSEGRRPIRRQHKAEA